MPKPTGVVGVSRHAKGRRFNVIVKRVWLGTYDTFEEALAVRDAYIKNNLAPIYNELCPCSQNDGKPSHQHP